MTVLIASHDLDLIRRLGRRVLVLKEGQIVDDLPARQTMTGDAHGSY